MVSPQRVWHECLWGKERCQGRPLQGLPTGWWVVKLPWSPDCFKDPPSGINPLSDHVTHTFSLGPSWSLPQYAGPPKTSFFCPPNGLVASWLLMCESVSFVLPNGGWPLESLSWMNTLYGAGERLSCWAPLPVPNRLIQRVFDFFNSSWIKINHALYMTKIGKGIKLYSGIAEVDIKYLGV